MPKPISPVPDFVPPEVKPDNPVTPKPKFDWSTPLAAKHSFRVMCDDNFLSLSEKNLLCAVLECESGFKIDAVNKNTNGTFDYGICQFNSYWYIEKMKLITKEQAMNDPEFSCALFIKRYKQGFLKDWICYKSGGYKQHL